MRTLGLVLLTLGLLACEPSGGRAARPQEVLRGYLDAIAANDFEQAYRHLAAVDRAGLRATDLPARIPRRGEYRIIRVHQYPDLSTIDVEFTSGEAKPSAQPATPGDPPAGAPTALESFTLVREQDGWKVLLAAHTAAQATEPLPPETAPVVEPDPPATPGSDEATDEATPTPVAATAQGIEVYALKAGYYRTALGRTVPGVEFKLRNRSGYNASRVAVTVYFQDRNGATISEETYYPVRSDGDGFLNTPPLKAGYLWQLERGKFFLAEAVPSEWRRGAVTVSVSEVRFAHQTATTENAGAGGTAGIP